MTNDPFFDEFKNMMNREVLKHAAGMHIFCPSCGQILDWKTVIIIDILDQEKKQVGQATCCSHCFNPERVEEVCREHQVTTEITRHQA